MPNSTFLSAGTLENFVANRTPKTISRSKPGNIFCPSGECEAGVNKLPARRSGVATVGGGDHAEPRRKYSIRSFVSDRWARSVLPFDERPERVQRLRVVVKFHPRCVYVLEVQKCLSGRHGVSAARGEKLVGGRPT